MEEQASGQKSDEEAPAVVARDLSVRWESTLAFGPRFFLAHLRAYVRDRCPDPGEMLPFVHIHIASGELLDVCHVIGLTQRWVALAVYEAPSRAMRTELVPYETIVRVTIRPGHAQGRHVGFQQAEQPAVQAIAEEALQTAAAGGAGPCLTQAVAHECG